MQGCTFVIPSLIYIKKKALSFGNFVDERIVVAAISSDQSCHKKGDLLRFYIPNTLDADLSLSSNKYKIFSVEITSCYI